MEKVYQFVEQCPVTFEEQFPSGKGYWYCILPPNHRGPHDYFRPEKIKDSSQNERNSPT